MTMLGCGIATVFAIIELLYGTRQAAYEAGVRQVESPYEAKSEHSHKTQGNESECAGSGNDEGSNKNGNPFENLDDD